MEHKMVTIPFDLETAKKIRKGERLGQIVTEKGRNRAEIVYEDDLCNAYPLLVVIHSIPVLADWFSSTGKAFNDANRLLLEVPEYATFKDREVLSNEPKAKEYLKRFFGIEEKPKYEFKPFDKVLVRNEEDEGWSISLFAREITVYSDELAYEYECSNGTLWNCCIPFEGNEYLLGTAENPEK